MTTVSSILNTRQGPVIPWTSRGTGAARFIHLRREMFSALDDVLARRQGMRWRGEGAPCWHWNTASLRASSQIFGADVLTETSIRANCHVELESRQPLTR